MGPGGGTEPRDLGQTACDEGGAGILAIAHAVINACSNGNDVLQSSTQLNSGDILGGVYAIASGAQQGAQIDGDGFILSSHHGGCGFPLGYFAREIGTAEGRQT